MSSNRRQSFPGSLPNAILVEFGNDPDHMENQLAMGRADFDRFLQ